jgi:2-polyprenyl-6-methoxyphenol hydroxylase-like FAD-dependent oxidoreductase
MSNVLIVGGGLGGLCLAHALKKNHIPFKLFEKDQKQDFRAQGYRLRISSPGIGALEYSLAPETWDLFKKTCAQFDPTSPMGRVDAATAVTPADAPMLGGPPPHMHGSDSLPYNVDRTVFREVLLAGLQSDVYFGRQFTHYETEDGQVRAFFADGTVETGTLLVGADGVGSRVRKQLLPQYPILDTGVRSIYGKTLLSEALEKQMTPNVLRGLSLAFDNDQSAPKTLLLEAMRFPRRSDVTEVPLPPDYVYWVLAVHRDYIPLADEKMLRLNHEQSAQLSLDLTEKWHPSLRVLLEAQDVAQTSTLRITSVLPELPDWEPSPLVTLLGDAIHNMPPTGGMGVNTALRDAEDLARRLGQAGIGPGCKSVVAEYEKSLREFARKTIGGSWQGGLKAFGMRPVEECERIDL